METLHCTTSTLMPAGHHLYVSCISKSTTVYSPVGCPCLGIRTREVHASFTPSLDVRNIFLITDHPDVFARLEHLHAPTWIMATSYCDVQFQTDDGVMEAALIDKFEVLPSVSCHIIHPVTQPSPVFGLPCVPSTSMCNCSSSDPGPPLLVDDPADVSFVSSNQSSRSTTSTPSSTASTTSPSLETVNMRVRGSTWESHYQETLLLCRRALAQNVPISLSLKHENDNVIDKNAISVSVTCQSLKLNNSVIGYIGKENIPRMHDAMSRGIIDISFLSITSYFSPPPDSKRIWQANINVTKSGKWLAKDNNYVYNKEL